MWRWGDTSSSLNYTEHKDTVLDMAIVAGGRVATTDGRMHVWSVETGKQIARFKKAGDSFGCVTECSAMTQDWPVFTRPDCSLWW